ncbi:MAG: L-serine ammonia-lyase, iron-sulfur-dependent, subunit alpha [Spirochaetia bacterium]
MYSANDILRIVTAPALGCTEPAAIALSAAAARSLLPRGEVTDIHITLDPNIYKNAMGVLIPGSGGRAGVELASAMGACGGNAESKMQVLTSVAEAELAQADALLDAGRVTAQIDQNRSELYIHTRITTASGSAEAVVAGLHDRIAELRIDGRTLSDHPLLPSSDGGEDPTDALEGWLRGQTVASLIELAVDLDEDAEALLREGIEYNTALADYGLAHPGGLGVGASIQQAQEEGIISDDLVTAARRTAAAASDARMSGAPHPAMSSSGSGNHGIVATNIVAAAGRHMGADERRILEGVSIAHVLTAYIKAHTGRLSALCGTAVAAGAGAAAGLVHLRGGGVSRAEAAVTNVIEDLAGIVCDGAKASCALKVATGAGSAVQAGFLAAAGRRVPGSEGIVSEEVEQTVRNLGRLSKPGMVETDRTILQIMIEEEARRAAPA